MSARSIEMLQICRRLLARFDRAALHKAQAELDAVETQRLVQAMLLGGRAAGEREEVRYSGRAIFEVSQSICQ